VLEIASSIEAAFRAEPADIPAPADFADRVMALVGAPVVEPLAPRLAPEPQRVPAWMALASDPVTAVGLTLALLLALAASWWPGRIVRAALLAGLWTWERASNVGTNLDPTTRIVAVLLAGTLIAFWVWHLWRAAERALVLHLAKTPER
jgi:hypothetical protein